MRWNFWKGNKKSRDPNIKYRDLEDTLRREIVDKTLEEGDNKEDIKTLNMLLNVIELGKWNGDS